MDPFLFQIMQGTNMYFLGSTIVTIRNAFGRRHERVKAEGKKEEEKKARFKLAKREFNTIAKLSVIMGGYFIRFKLKNNWTYNNIIPCVPFDLDSGMGLL